MTIQSNKTTPSMCATGLSSSAAGVNTGGKVTVDGSSSIAGNGTLANHINTESSYANSVASNILQFVSLIQSVASEFDVLDNELSHQIQANQSQFVAAPEMPDVFQKSSKVTSYKEGIAAPSWQQASASQGSVQMPNLFNNGGINDGTGSR